MDTTRSPVIFDVGANFGEFGLSVAKKRPNVQVHLFEPIPKLIIHITEEAKNLNLKNISIHPYGIASTAGEVKLNISSKKDMGCSSILNFAQKNIDNDEYWALRDDLQFDNSIVVKVKTMHDVLEKLHIQHVDFIKIDVQGLELDVLKSFGKYLKYLNAGMFEVASTSSKKLYENSPDLRDSLNFLYDEGFEVVAIKPNDSASNELNLYFCRNAAKWETLINDLGLKGNQIFDGKYYWYNPSNLLVIKKSRERLYQKIWRKSPNRIKKIIRRLKIAKIIRNRTLYD